jgi:ABC-type branched-subunit amino acid transport system ATPase component
MRVTLLRIMVFPHRSVENVLTGLYRHHAWPPPRHAGPPPPSIEMQARDEAEELLRMSELSAVANARAGNLPFGTARASGAAGRQTFCSS